MKYTRIQQNTVDMENAISFRQYVESLEQRYREDRQTYKEDLQRLDALRIADNERLDALRIADNEKAEKLREADFAKFQAEIATHRTEIKADITTFKTEIQADLKAHKTDLQQTFRNNIFIPLLVAIVIFFLSLGVPLAINTWRSVFTPPPVQSQQ